MNMSTRKWMKVGGALLATELLHLAPQARGDGPFVTVWGYNYFGKTAVPDDLGHTVSVAAGAYHVVALSSAGVVRCWGANGSGQCDVPGSLSPATAIAAGDAHTLAIVAGNTVRAWGANGHGQSSVPTGLQASRIAAGAEHSLAIRPDGTLSAWGRNDSGQTSVPAGLVTVTAVDGGGGHSVAVRTDGTVVCWGANDAGQCTVPPGTGAVTSVAAGREHTVALRSDGTVACWGGNSNGQCDVPAALDSVIAIDARGVRTAAIRSGPLVECDDRYVQWGRRYSYNYGWLAPSFGPQGLSAMALGDFFTVAVGPSGDAGSGSFLRRKSMRVISVTGGASVSHYEGCDESLGYEASECERGLPDGLYGDVRYCYKNDLDVGVECEVRQDRVRIRQGYPLSGNEYLSGGCFTCGDTGDPWCPDYGGTASLALWLRFDRPHAILVDSLLVDGVVGDWWSDPYGGAFSSYCPAAESRVRVEAFWATAGCEPGPPRPGPWGSTSRDLGPGESLSLAMPQQSQDAIETYLFKVTIPFSLITSLETPLYGRTELVISRAWPAADVVPDGIVNAEDLSAVIAEWGRDCFGRAASDTNRDGRVDGVDLGAVLFAWGTPG